MSGLLDIWREWRDGSYSPKGYTWGSQETDVDIASSTGNNSIFKKRTDLSTAGGTNEPKVNQKSIRVDGQGNMYQGDTFIGKGNPYSKRVDSKGNVSSINKGNMGIGNEKSLFKQPDGSIYKGGKFHSEGNTKSINTSGAVQDASKTPFHPSQGDIKYHGGNQQEQLKWWETLANKVGFDPEKAKATWEKKGGFEGLMANPAFTMGLAFMSAGAEGKNIGQGALDNVMKAAGISSHYKKILKDRQEEPIQATAADMAEVEDLLASINIKEGNWLENAWRKFKGGNPGAEWSMAVEEISLKYQEKVRAKQKALKKAGKPQTLRRSDQIKIMQELIDSGVIKKKKSKTGGILTAHTLSMPTPMAEGGPIESGKPYLVGEKGPEVIIPKSDGNVIANDDSQIFAMLLASNPQLQNVSRQRAEKILRSRFPEYFE